MAGKKYAITNRRDTYVAGLYDHRGRLVCLKIGLCTRGKWTTRLKNLQSGSVHRIRLMILLEGNWEKKYHARYSQYRLKHGEFFKPAPEILRMVESMKEVQRLLRLLEAKEARSGRNSSSDHKRRNHGN